MSFFNTTTFNTIDNLNNNITNSTSDKQDDYLFFFEIMTIYFSVIICLFCTTHYFCRIEERLIDREERLLNIAQGIDDIEETLEESCIRIIATSL